MLEFGKWLKDDRNYYYLLYKTADEVRGLFYSPARNKLKLTNMVSYPEEWIHVNYAKQEPQLSHLITSQKIHVIEEMFKFKWRL